MIERSSLEREFAAWSGSLPALFRAPGRVNLIGEHTDYNSGFVMPAALEFETTIAIATRPDPALRVRSLAFADTAEIGLEDRRALQSRRARGHWSDYVLGVVLALWDRDIPVKGADMLIQSDIPLGSGLSSSASFEVCTALALSEMAERPLERLTLATLCQKAENDFVGTRCGIMDQFASAFGKANHALALDCRNLEYRQVPLTVDGDAPNERVSIVICNTMVRHAHAGGEYNQRRAECEAAVDHLSRVMPGVQSLRDVSLEDLQIHGHGLDPVVRRRARHIVSENGRVVAAIDALQCGDAARFGQLMRESHRSLRDDYEVSCSELDLMAGIADQLDGVYGARMTGGGFGGCTVNWVRSNAVASFTAAIGERYARATGLDPEIYVCATADGASRVDVGS